MYFDTSAMVSLFVPEPASNTVTSLVERLEQRPALSDYGAGEFASAVSRLVRIRSYSDDQGHAILAAFDRWTIRSADLVQIRPADIRRATAIVRQFSLKLRFPDALHVAVCLERDLPLVTRDGLMANAARQLDIAVTLVD